MTTDNKGYQSSTDYQPTGVTVLGNGGSGYQREVQSADALEDKDLINVAGMQMTAAQARDLGLLGKVFSDESLSAGSARQRPEETEADAEVVQKSDTGHAAYDEAIDSLNIMIDEGSMTLEEGKVYDASLAEIAFVGLEVEEVANTLSGLADGTLDKSEVSPDLQALATNVETQIKQAATKAALNELGKPAFDALTGLAGMHTGVADVIKRYAIDRAQGKHGGVSWSDLYADIQEQVGNA